MKRKASQMSSLLKYVVNNILKPVEHQVWDFTIWDVHKSAKSYFALNLITSTVRLRIRCIVNHFLACKPLLLWEVFTKMASKVCVWGACRLGPPSQEKPSSLSDHQNTSCQLFPSPPHPSLHTVRERVAWQRRVWIRSRWRRGVTASVSAGTRAFLLSQRPASQNTSTTHTHTEIDTHAQTVLPFLQLAGSLSYPAHETEREGNGKRDKTDIDRQTDDRMNSRKKDRESQARMEPGRQTHTHKQSASLTMCWS